MQLPKSEQLNIASFCPFFLKVISECIVPNTDKFCRLKKRLAKIFGSTLSHFCMC